MRTTITRYCRCFIVVFETKRGTNRCWVYRVILFSFTDFKISLWICNIWVLKKERKKKSVRRGTHFHGSAVPLREFAPEWIIRPKPRYYHSDPSSWTDGSCLLLHETNETWRLSNTDLITGRSSFPVSCEFNMKRRRSGINLQENL